MKNNLVFFELSFITSECLLRNEGRKRKENLITTKGKLFPFFFFFEVQIIWTLISLKKKIYPKGVW